MQRELEVTRLEANEAGAVDKLASRSHMSMKSSPEMFQKKINKIDMLTGPTKHEVLSKLI